MLRRRIITALVLIPPVVFAIFTPDVRWLSLLFGLFIAIGAWEWGTLCHLSKKLSCFYSLAVILILIGLYQLNNYTIYSSLILAGGLYWGFAVCLLLFYPRPNRLFAGPSYFFLTAGLFVLIPMWSGLILLKKEEGGAPLLMLLMLLIWSADTAAYFAGKKWGKHKLAARVSPGKTWEGAIAGAAAGVAVALCYAIAVGIALDSQWLFAGLLAATVVVSVFGDLMESLIKRKANRKNSSSLLWGHGGVMDRIDSLTAASPLFVLGLIHLETLS